MNITNYHSSFDKNLDESYSIIKIGSFEMNPSEALKNLDPSSYDEQCWEWLGSEIQKSYDEAEETLPFPIAFYLHKYKNDADNDNHRLHLLRSMWEATINLLFTLAVIEFAHLGYRLGSVDVSETKNGGKYISWDFLVSDKMNDRILTIERILQFLDDNSITSQFLGEITELEICSELKKLSRERNNFQHRSAIPDEEAKRLIEDKLDEPIHNLLFFLRTLSARIIHFQRTGGSLSELKFKEYSSDGRKKGIDIDKGDFTSCPDSLINASFLHILWGDNLICLSPFLIFDRGKICFFKKKKNTSTYIYETIEETPIEFEVTVTQIQPSIDHIQALI